MMEAISFGGITRDKTRRSVEEGGTPPEMLVSSLRPEVRFWQQAIDQMLRWKSDPGEFDAEDRPDEAVLYTAIDYAVDQIEDDAGAPAPASIVASGGGRIAMEWNDGPFTVIIEFTGLGEAVYTAFVEGKINSRHKLVRNPKSRQLEFRG